jgi:caspase domain-containing protein
MSLGKQAASKWALLVGIDHYLRLGEGLQLAGCVNDVEAMAQVLIGRFGFPADQVIKLTNEAATRVTILAAMERLVTQVRQGDSVVFHYAGHGSQAPSLDPGEVDGKDETIVPHDSARHANFPNLDIHDKEIHGWLERLTAVTENITLIFDSCHSGGITRDAAGARARWVPPDTRAIERSLFPPRTRSARGEARGTGPSGWVPLGQRYVLLAGCQSSESSYELTAPGDGSLQHGALSYFLCRHLAGAGPGTTYRDVFEAAASQVTGNCSLQHPQLEGECDRVLFGIKRIEPMRFAPVRQRRGEQIVLGAGRAMGASEGSTWAIYPPGTKQATNGQVAVGTIRITAAWGVTSDAEILTETSAGAIAAAARAVELSHDYGDLALLVRVAPSGGQGSEGIALAAAIAGSQVLRPAREGEAADATVHLLPPRESAAADAPVPQVARLPAPAWAVVGKGGELILPLCPAGHGASQRLLDNLVKRARYRIALDLQNPVSRLFGAVDLVLLRQRDDGEWGVAGAGPGGETTFTEGERLAFELRNRSSVPLYFYVLDLGLSGRISPVYPIPGIDEPLSPGGQVRFGARADEKIEVTLPDDLPFLPGAPRAAAAGQGTLKLLATTRPTHFRALYQPGYRAERPRGALDRLLGMTAGAPCRDLRVQTSREDDDWTALARSFGVHPRAEGGA